METALPFQKATLRQGGFTMVEVLAALLILMVLVAILLPTSSVFVARGKQTKCAANLRQIGAAFILYAGDNNGRIGNYDRDNITAWGGNAPMWGGPPLEQRSLGAYITDPRVFQCPADIGGAAGNDFSHSNYVWAGNSYDVANSTERGVTYLSANNPYRPGNSVPGTLAAVDKPGRVILAFDSTFLREAKKYWHPKDRSNVVMLDGHVEAMPKEWGRTYPSNPDIYSFGWIGWPGYPDLWDPGQK